MPQPATAPPTPSPFVMYRNAGLGLILRYPALWEKVEESSPIAFALLFRAPADDPASQFRENVLITIQPLLGQITLDEYVLFRLREFQGRFQFAEPAPATLAGIPARQLNYSGALDPMLPIPARFSTLVALKDNRAYMFSYTARAENFDLYWPFVQEMIASVNIL
jgi:hypothetical protein